MQIIIYRKRKTVERVKEICPESKNSEIDIFDYNLSKENLADEELKNIYNVINRNPTEIGIYFESFYSQIKTWIDDPINYKVPSSFLYLTVIDVVVNKKIEEVMQEVRKLPRTTSGLYSWEDKEKIGEKKSSIALKYC